MSEVTICYGMTETCPGVDPDPAEDALTAGCRPSGGCIPHVEVKIVDPEPG